MFNDCQYDQSMRGSLLVSTGYTHSAACRRRQMVDKLSERVVPNLGGHLFTKKTKSSILTAVMACLFLVPLTSASASGDVALRDPCYATVSPSSNSATATKQGTCSSYKVRAYLQCTTGRSTGPWIQSGSSTAWCGGGGFRSTEYGYETQSISGGAISVHRVG